ncbi:MAG: DUF429 domain-containing protein [Acidimicrobiia bacterium]|nr:DUF429 domain-containing protein [Acidimicrobiia bacterium]
MAIVVGFDGCKAGWVGVKLENGLFTAAMVSETISAAIDAVPDAAAIGVDMPIGTPESEPRAAEREAKQLLGARAATIFLTPPQAVLEAPTYTAARLLSTQQFGRSVSAQAYALRHRILELAPLAAADTRIHEVHPELAFREMNGGEPIAANKKSWAGQTRRRRLLARCGVDLPEDLGMAGAVAPDDILDAAAAAWTAGRIARRRARRLPKSALPSKSAVPREGIWY